MRPMFKDDEKQEEILHKYLKNTPDELKTLSEIYKAKIKHKEDNHLLNKLQSRTKYDLRKIIIRISLTMVIIGMLLFLSFVIYSMITKQPEKVLPKLTYTMFPSLVLIIGGVSLMGLLDDGTSGWRKELRNIELTLEKKEANPMKSIVFDTNIYDDFINGNITLQEIEKAKEKGYKFFISQVQVEEISDCSDAEKRKQMNLFMVSTSPKIVPTESFVLGASRLGFSKLGDGKVLEDLQENKDKLKSLKDSMIGEITINNGYLLITNDKQLKNTVSSNGGRCVSLQEFKKMVA